MYDVIHLSLPILVYVYAVECLHSIDNAKMKVFVRIHIQVKKKTTV